MNKVIFAQAAWAHIHPGIELVLAIRPINRVLLKTDRRITEE
jgi:hypothetical protein